MFIRKFKFFLMAGIAALYISCSDDSNSLNASDAGRDDGKIADTSTPNYGTRRRRLSRSSPLCARSDIAELLLERIGSFTNCILDS